MVTELAAAMACEACQARQHPPLMAYRCQLASIERLSTVVDWLAYGLQALPTVVAVAKSIA